MHLSRLLTNAVVLLIFFALTTSCDCIQRVSGTVLDIDTKKPLDSVLVKKVNKFEESYTDSIGRFEIKSISGGLFKCPPMKIEISKDGYVNEIMEIKNEGDEMIYLKKKNN